MLNTEHGILSTGFVFFSDPSVTLGSVKVPSLSWSQLFVLIVLRFSWTSGLRSGSDISLLDLLTWSTGEGGEGEGSPGY